MQNLRGKNMKRVFKQIKKKIDNVDVISFDVFDTLIKRDVLIPTDIFKIVEKRYNLLYETKINNFCHERITAEKTAREKKKQEVNIDDIYISMRYADEIKNILKNIEIEVEMDYCKINKEIEEIYEYCKEKNKKVICISDMYLSKNVVKNILEENGIYADDIFVSSEYKENKLSGKLFDVVIKKLNINKSQIIHIGDSYKADFLSPIKNRIKAYHIRKFENKCNFLKIKREEKEISLSIIYAMINNNIALNNSYYEKLGYEIFGPICSSFTNWIHKIISENKIENILFCARDMKLIQEIYNEYYGNEKVNNVYFYVSRKSTYLPYLYVQQGYSKFADLIPYGNRKVEIKELLELYNINNINVDILERYDLDANKKYQMSELSKSSNFKKYYNNEILKIVNKKGKEQYQNFIKYLKANHIDKKTAIVDLGWRGTTQKIMMDIVGKNIYGLYFGLYTKNERYLKNNYWTYLFKDEKSEYASKVYSFMTIIELLFSALHGSTIGYSSNSKIPYILSDSANKNNEFIIGIQKGAMDFCKDVKKYINDIQFEEIDKIFIDKLIEIGINPTLKQAEIIGNMYTENLKTRVLAKPKKLYKYILNPKSLKEDITDTEWKIGFLKRLLKIKLPFFKIYSVLRKRRKE